MKLSNFIKIFTISVLFLLALQIKCYAGSIGISASKQTAEPGETVTIYVTGNNAYGQINLQGTNIALSSNRVWVDENTVSVTGKIVGEDGATATITATPSDKNLVDSDDPSQVITESKSITINIKKKEEPPQDNTQTSPSTGGNSSGNTSGGGSSSGNNSGGSSSGGSNTSGNKSNGSTSNNKNNNKNTNNKNNQSTNTNKTNPEQNIIEDNEDQGTISEFGLTSLYVYGVNEDDEKIELELSPQFDINTFEYTCNADNTILNIELEREANEYEKFVTVEGLDNPLEEGENIIKIILNDNQGNLKEYIIKVTKEKLQETNSDEVMAENSNEISFTVPQFIVLQLSIIILEILITILVIKIKNKYSISKHG